MSQLVTVFPLGQIDPDTTPGPRQGRRPHTRTARGPGAMGWSWAWKIRAARPACVTPPPPRVSLLLEAIRPLDGDPARFADPTGAERLRRPAAETCSARTRRSRSTATTA